MSIPTRVRWVSDPNHGWLAVSLEDYPDAIEYGTGFGYMNEEANTIFLEEDCEAVAFLTAHPELVDISEEPSNRYHPCRLLPRNEARLDV